MASVRRSLENHWRILLRAFGLLTKLSQSRDGPAVSDLEVSTSTVSPFSSLVSSGTRRPLTRAPMVRWPTSVCTAYAKSTGVACAGSETILPFGVNTYTSAAPRSSLSEPRNSLESGVSLVQSASCWIHLRLSASDSSWLSPPPRLRSDLSGELSARPAWPFSLYFQCAAMPNSARRCMSHVRIWISTGLPPGPTTVVCSDWYMLSFGMAM